jgi:hypothetical protein
MKKYILFYLFLPKGNYLEFLKPRNLFNKQFYKLIDQ